MSRATAARPTDAASKSGKSAKGYFQRSELPLTSLVFLVPFLLVYEVGTVYFPTHVIAFTWMRDFFGLFRASGKHLPALAVVAILLGWHVFRHDKWEVSPRHLVGMLLESFAVSIPLVLMGMLAVRYLPLMVVRNLGGGPIVLSIGAGIYEELVFRLIAFSGLSFVLIDVLEIKRSWAYVLMVVVTSLAFSLYHYLGYEAFQVRTFAFRTAAGVYFGIIFILRGFGITAGSHAAYDIVVHALQSVG